MKGGARRTEASSSSVGATLRRRSLGLGDVRSRPIKKKIQHQKLIKNLRKQLISLFNILFSLSPLFFYFHYYYSPAIRVRGDAHNPNKTHQKQSWPSLVI